MPVAVSSPLLSRKQAAEFLGVGEQTLAAWATLGAIGCHSLRWADLQNIGSPILRIFLNRARSIAVRKANP